MKEEHEGANLLHRLARRTRLDLLSDIWALAPAIAKLGGSEAAKEAWDAIQDAICWWPGDWRALPRCQVDDGIQDDLLEESPVVDLECHSAGGVGGPHWGDPLP